MEVLTSQSKVDREIDLLKIFQILWVSKWKVFLISILCSFFGIYLHLNENDNYEVSFDISTGPESKFFEYIKINELLSTNPLLMPTTDEFGNLITFYNITPKGVLNKFVNQFKNKSGIIEALSSSPYNEIFLSNDIVIENKILNKSKEFIIFKKDNNSFSIKFDWPNIDQINGLSDIIVEKVLLNVKKDILYDLKMLKELNESKKKRESDEISQKIQLLNLASDDSLRSRLIFLEEQLSIAKNLNIETNDTASFYSLPQTLLNEQNYFLVGQNAILEEIKKIKNRTSENSRLLSGEYLSLINELRNIKSDKFPEKIEKEIAMFIEEKPDNWISYNFGFANISNKRNSHLFIPLSFFIGLLLGIFYVMIISINSKKA